MLPAGFLAIVDAPDRESRAGALRRLLAPLRPDGLDEEGGTWDRLSALCERVESATLGSDPERSHGRPGSDDLTNGWWQCRHCAEAYEGSGTESRCPSCGAILAGTEPVLVLEFRGGGTLWLGAPDDDGEQIASRFGSLRRLFGWIHAHRDGRRFVLLDEAAQALAKAGMPSATITAVRDRPPIARIDGSRYLFAKPDQLECVELDRADPDAIPVPHPGVTPRGLLARELARVLSLDGDLAALRDVAASVAAQLEAIDRATIWTAFAWEHDANGYLSSRALETALATRHLPATAIAHIARVLMSAATFLPGSHFVPKALADDASRRIGSPLPVLTHVLAVLRPASEAVFLDVAAELLGMVLVDADVFDHDPDGFHCDVAAELADSFTATPLDLLPGATRAALVRSFRRGCDSCARSQFGLDLVPLGLALLATAGEDRRDILDGLTRFFALDEPDPGDYKVSGYVEKAIIPVETLHAYAQRLDDLGVQSIDPGPGARLIGQLRAVR